MTRWREDGPVNLVTPPDSPRTAAKNKCDEIAQYLAMVDEREIERFANIDPLSMHVDAGCYLEELYRRWKNPPRDGEDMKLMKDDFNPDNYPIFTSDDAGARAAKIARFRKKVQDDRRKESMDPYKLLADRKRIKDDDEEDIKNFETAPPAFETEQDYKNMVWQRWQAQPYTEEQIKECDDDHNPDNYPIFESDDAGARAVKVARYRATVEARRRGRDDVTSDEWIVEMFRRNVVDAADDDCADPTPIYATDNADAREAKVAALMEYLRRMA